MFDVSHGLGVALVERPENYVTLVDLGSSDDVSPLKELAYKRSLRPDILFITHPHADHLADIDTAMNGLFCPDAIYFQEYDWVDVKRRERPRLADKIDRFRVLTKKIPLGTYSGRASLMPWGYTPDQARRSFGESSYVNNSSLLIVYSWRDFKIVISGDQELPALEAFLKSDNFCKSASNFNILIPPHHGHSGSFTQLWTKRLGNPYVSIISATENDPHVDGRYSSLDFAKGVAFGNERRFALTTRQDGSISVLMRYNLHGEPEWEFLAF